MAVTIGFTEQQSSEQLLTLWGRLDARNRELGYARYDFGDVQSHPVVRRLAAGKAGRLLLKPLQALELASPKLWRRVLGIPKQVVPSLFYHLGMTYTVRGRLSAPPDNIAQSVEEVCRRALELRLDAEHVCWRHPYMHHAGTWRGGLDPGVPPSCGHHTARVGLMLLYAGETLGQPDLTHAGISAARALLAYHRWNTCSDGSCTVSYYPDTRDEVINTGADAAVLLAAVPGAERTPAMQTSLEGLTRMIVSEQLPDGSWYYCTRRHYENLGGARIIDNHHTAMNLGALTRLVGSGALPPSLAEAARKALDLGVEFYLENLFRPDGRGRHMIGRRRPCGVVGYSEGVSALSAYLDGAGGRSRAAAAKAGKMAPRLLANAIDRFVDRKTGDVACYRFFGRPYHIQSARWGSAPLMQAITDYVACRETTRS